MKKCALSNELGFRKWWNCVKKKQKSKCESHIYHGIEIGPWVQYSKHFKNGHLFPCQCRAFIRVRRPITLDTLCVPLHTQLCHQKWRLDFVSFVVTKRTTVHSNRPFGRSHSPIKMTLPSLSVLYFCYSSHKTNNSARNWSTYSSPFSDKYDNLVSRSPLLVFLTQTAGTYAHTNSLYLTLMNLWCCQPSVGCECMNWLLASVRITISMCAQTHPKYRSASIWLHIWNDTSAWKKR